MNVTQRLTLQAVAFRSYDGTRGIAEDEERGALAWLARKGYISSAAWDAEVTQDGYVAGIASGALAMYLMLSDKLTLEVNSSGPGSLHSSPEHRARYLAAVKRGLLDGSLKLVESESSGYYRVVVR